MLVVLAAAAAAAVLDTCQGRPNQVFVATSARPGTTVQLQEETAATSPPPDPHAKPVISQFLVRSDVQFRYARTRVESHVKNPASLAQTVTFSLVIPDRAFVSNFSMLLGEEEVVAEVKGKEEAKETFEQAVRGGVGAGLVEQSARDANVISVQANVEPGSKVRFALTYEELLIRKLGRYEHVIHVNPGQIVDDFRVDVHIDESLPVEQVRVPKLKTDPNSITSQEPNPLAKVIHDPSDPSRVHIVFVADRAAQKAMSREGVDGQLIVQYDVDSQGKTGDIQLLDGYFVHFFSPDDLPTLPKHVVFVLDVSGSMSGTKLDQTKDAMVTILDDMGDKDFFSIITFNNRVHPWAPRGPSEVSFRGTKENREEALTYALQLSAGGGTNINDAMLAALNLIRDMNGTDDARPMVIFLTDGQPTSGVRSPHAILANVLAANGDMEAPIYGLAFGRGADFGLIKKISLANGGFARRIYEGSDAAIQLEDFYGQIAGPLLASVEFDYVGENVASSTVTKKRFDVLNRGNELVVAGKLGGEVLGDEIEVSIKGKGFGGDFEKRIKICLRPPTTLPTSPIPEMPVPVPKVGAAEHPGADDGEALPTPLRTVPAEDEDDKEAVQASVVAPEHLPFPTPPPRHLPPPPPFGHLPPPPSPPPPPRHCIPLPPPRPEEEEEPRSEHENFIERLWAFLTIKEYLDEKPTSTQERRTELLRAVTTTTTTTTTTVTTTSTTTTSTNDTSTSTTPPPPPEEEKAKEAGKDSTVAVAVIPPPREKTNREKALDLALRYNFVTPVTSLVVTRPGDNATEAIDPVPVSSRPKRPRNPWTGGGRKGLHIQSAQNLYGISRHSGMGLSGGRRGGVVSRRLPRPFGISSIQKIGLPASCPTCMQRQPQHGGGGFLQVDLLAMPPPPPPPSSSLSTPPRCSGKIILYDKTYRRGDKVEVDGDVDDLAAVGFDDRLKSLEVEGDCCWRVFADAGHSGPSMFFGRGVWDSPSRIAELVKRASSVKVVPC